LPDCAGVALGLDRLLMITAGKTCLRDVLSFPLERA
jgi:lysyl-tRNA synthetase class 2